MVKQSCMAHTHNNMLTASAAGAAVRGGGVLHDEGGQELDVLNLAPLPTHKPTNASMNHPTKQNILSAIVVYVLGAH